MIDECLLSLLVFLAIQIHCFVSLPAVMCSLNFCNIFVGRLHFYPHFTDAGIEAQGGYVTLLGPHSYRGQRGDTREHS